MSQVRLFFNPLDARSEVKYELEAGTQLIDFLQEHYPVGFDGALVVYVGTEPLDLEDLDYEIGDEAVTMLVMPAGISGAGAFLTWLGPILLQALIGAAIGLAIGLIFAPSSPNGSIGEESAVYSINATRNRTRVNEPIGTHYGTISYPPDFGAAPYIFFNESSNDMYVDELLCLGNGEFEILDIFIGEANVLDLQAGTVMHWIYGPDDHQEKLGVIEADVWNHVKDTPVPLPFYENMFTSPEIQEWTFSSEIVENTTLDWAAITGTAVAEGIYAPTGQPLPGRLISIPDTVVCGPGDTFTLQNTTSNNVSFVVDAVTPGDNPGFITIFERYKDAIISDEAPLNAASQYKVNSVATAMIAGPFLAQKQGTIINAAVCDIIFPGGLFHVSSSGNIRNREVQMIFTFQQIDPDTGSPINAPLIINKDFNGSQKTPYRASVYSGALEPGAYEVTVERVTPIPDDTDNSDTTVWAGLKGAVVLDTEAEAYGPVTLLAMRLKATNGLGEAARARVRVTAKRLMDGDSDNPITVIKDIFLNDQYGMGRSDTELNLVELDALELEYAQPDGPRFNGSFDQRQTGWESMQNVASMFAGRMVQHNAFLTVVPDRVQDVRTALFTSANIIQDTLEITYTFDVEGEFDGVDIEYRNPENFQPLHVQYPEGAENPETFVLFGCTDETYAREFANYLWNVRFVRRRIVKFSVEKEGLIPRFGDRIGVSHPLPDWGESGIFVEQVGSLEWRVDRFLTWDANSSNNNMILRTDDGSPTDPIQVKKGNHPDSVIFLSPPPIEVFVAGLREPTVYSFGRYYSQVKDFVLTRITPDSDNQVTIEGQLYDDSIYNGGPPHMGGT